MTLLKRNRVAGKTGGRQKKYLKMNELIELRYGACSGEVKMARVPKEISAAEVSEAIELWLTHSSQEEEEGTPMPSECGRLAERCESVSGQSLENDTILRDDLVLFIENWKLRVHPTSPRWQQAREIISELEELIE
ncbi:hypothetical protein B4U84_24340 [Westiellopsis prolifica IICB1]|nr:hypothetical protein B4U84_24340 [Westiellopsis prolifica IICB1]